MPGISVDSQQRRDVVKNNKFMYSEVTGVYAICCIKNHKMPSDFVKELDGF